MIKANLHFSFCIFQTIIFVQQTSSFILICKLISENLLSLTDSVCQSKRQKKCANAELIQLLMRLSVFEAFSKTYNHVIGYLNGL